MNTRRFGSRYTLGASGFLTVLGVVAALVALPPRSSQAGYFDSWFSGNTSTHPDSSGGVVEHLCAGEPGVHRRLWVHSSTGCVVEHKWIGEPGGTWYWLRSPEEERRVIIGQYNRYCIRCHGVDGRGVWDIPDVPDFTNPRWQASRTDAQLVRLTLEGRGAVMPPFRGTLTLEEGWGMARYLRTFLPGSEKSRPDTGSSGKESLPEPRPVKKTDPDAAPPVKDKKSDRETDRKP